MLLIVSLVAGICKEIISQFLQSSSALSTSSIPAFSKTFYSCQLRPIWPKDNKTNFLPLSSVPVFPL